MLSIMKIQRMQGTFQEQVLNQLGQDICSGRYASGDLLPSEIELCERFNLSRIVIREAIKSLAAKGMIEVRRKVGTLVLEQDCWSLFDPDIITWRANTATLDRKLLSDLMELRRIVEPTAARLAASRASNEERLAVRHAYLAMDAAAAGNGDYVLADLAFHTAILLACDNQFIKQMRNAFGAILRTGFNVITQKLGGPLFSLPMHEALCIAIERGDADAAERAALALIEQAEIDLNDCLASFNPDEQTI